MTNFASTLETQLDSLISQRPILDSSLTTVARSASKSQSLVNEISNTAQNAGNGMGDTVAGAEDLSDSASEQLAKVTSHIQGFYMVGLWGYCQGSFYSAHSTVTNCTAPSSTFWFNSTKVLGLEESWAEKIIPSEVEKVIDVYRAASRGITAAYIIAVITTVLTIITGLTATLSRWGSLLVSICAMGSLVSNLAGSVTVTGVYTSLVGALESVFKSTGIDASMGRSMISTSWLASAFYLGSCIFWMVSICYC